MVVWKREDLTEEEVEKLTAWQVIPEGKSLLGGCLRDTHDEDGNLVIAPYRGRHIVDGFGRIICEFIHDETDAKLIAAAPRLMAALEACVDLIKRMREKIDDSDGAVQSVIDKAEEALRMAEEGS